MTGKRVLLAEPHGFCAGVERAIRLCREALRESESGRVYCYHEIVHNPTVVSELQAEGVVFVERLSDAPRGATLLFSAHGVPPCARREAVDRGLNVVDATCPFVAKVHEEARRFAGEGLPVILIGFRKHDEIVGVAGEAPDAVCVVENAAEAEMLDIPDGERVAVLSQTTLSQAETEKVMGVLRRRYPELRTPSRGDICYATTNRQAAAREVARRCSYVLVLGARNSSNSNRLVEVARDEGAEAHLVSDIAELRSLEPQWRGLKALGVSAGASTPDSDIESAKGVLRDAGFTDVREVRVAEEDIHFTT